MSSGLSLFRQDRPRASRRVLAVGLVIVLAVLGSLYVVLYYVETTASAALAGAKPDRADNDITGDRRRYGIVIDAGSSGSRAMIYAWDDPSSSPLAVNGSYRLPAIEKAGEHWTYKTSPGISSFAEKPHRVGIEHIKPLLDYAQRAMPKRQIPHTPVLLLATAGMRLLAPAHQSQILDMACSYARTNYEFLLPDCQTSFQVVSGELEGLYGWVAVNYLMGGFKDGDKSTHGFLDMGGASAQIAFEPAKKAALVHQHDLATVTLRGMDGTDVSHQVFVATFLGHGTNEARRRYVEMLQQNGTQRNAASSKVPVVDDPCLGAGLALPTTKGKQVVLRGTGQFSKCVAATEPLLNNTVCPIEPCLFAGVHAPEIDFGVQQFVGVSEYWFASHDYLGLGGMWDVNKYETRATEFCQKPWSEARQLVGGDHLAMGRLQMQCFKAAWLVNVLHKGFGVPRKATTPGLASSPFQSVSEVGEIEVSWTLGALLLKVSGTIPANYQTLKAKTSPGVALPDNPGADEGNVVLVDDSLWSPFQFVGLRRLVVMWSLQPPAVKCVLALAMLAILALLAALVIWTYRHYKYRRVLAGSDSPTIPLQNLDNGLASRSPSMFVLDMLSNGRRTVPSSPSAVAHNKPLQHEEVDSNGQQRQVIHNPALATVVALEDSRENVSMSRSSSVNNLEGLMSRRRL